MSRLVYPDVASEFVYPDGRSIPVYYPMGPRQEKTIEIRLPDGPLPIRHQSTAMMGYLKQYDPGSKGISISQLKHLTAWSDGAIRTILTRNPHLFRRSETQVPTEFMRDGALCVKYMYKFYLVTPVTQEEKNADNN